MPKWHFGGDLSHLDPKSFDLSAPLKAQSPHFRNAEDCERSRFRGRHQVFGVAPAKCGVTTRYPGGDAKEASDYTGVDFKIEVPHKLTCLLRRNKGRVGLGD